jgi:hypothetical protein
MLLDSAIYDASLSVEKRCSLLCSRGRRMLIERLIDIDRPSLEPALSSLDEVKFVDSYRTVMGMALVPQSLEQLMDFKLHPDVRRYANGFLEVALSEAGPTNGTDVKTVARLVREAMETEKTAKLFGGLLKWSGLFFKLLHVPIAGLGTAALSGTAQHIVAKAGWYEFAGCIERQVDKKALDKKLSEYEAGK